MFVLEVGALHMLECRLGLRMAEPGAVICAKQRLNMEPQLLF